MIEPTFLEYKQIAALKHDPGYQLLCSRIKADIDNLADELEIAVPHLEGQILAKWKAMRQIYTILATAPEKFASEVASFVEQEEAEKGPQMPSRIQPVKKHLTLTELEALRVAYEAEMDKKKV